MILLHIYIIPTFTFFTIVFSIRFVYLSKDKIIFILSGAFLNIIKFLAVIDSFIFNLKLKSLPKIDKQKFYEEIDIKKFNYEDMKINENNLLICFITTLIEFILLYLLLFLNRKKKMKKNDNYDCHSITILIIFGVIIVILIDFYVIYAESCDCEYCYDFYYSDRLEISRYYIFVNNTKIYLSAKRLGLIYNYEKDNFTYYYKDYPILKELDNIYETSLLYHCERLVWKSIDGLEIGLLYIIVNVLLTPFCLFLTFLFFHIYKKYNKCRLAFITLYIIFLVSTFISILFLVIRFNTNESKEYLINDKEEIQYIIDDYNQFANCVIKFPSGKIFEFFYFIILLFPLIFEMECFIRCKY